MTAIPELVVVHVLIVVVPLVIAVRLPSVVAPTAVIKLAPLISHNNLLTNLFTCTAVVSNSRDNSYACQRLHEHVLLG